MNNIKNEAEPSTLYPRINIPEDSERMVMLPYIDGLVEIDGIVESLRKDLVVMISNVSPEDSERIIHGVSKEFGLQDTLELQAGFGPSTGLRERIGKYFMTVSRRKHYSIAPPHSEGSGFANMQLASFYCYENSVDGGETILLNTSESSNVWNVLRERRSRIRPCPRKLTKGELAKLRAFFKISLPEDLLRDSDVVLRENSITPDITVCSVMAKLKKAYSRILEKEIYVFWESISAVDHDILDFFAQLLRESKLLKETPSYQDVRQLDWEPDNNREVRSGATYENLFKCKITHKLNPGEMVILNNLTWCHSVNNWTPDSGIRNIVVAFA